MIVLCLKETLYLDWRRAVRGACHLMIVSNSSKDINGPGFQSNFSIPDSCKERVSDDKVQTRRRIGLCWRMSSRWAFKMRRYIHWPLPDTITIRFTALYERSVPRVLKMY